MQPKITQIQFNGQIYSAPNRIASAEEFKELDNLFRNHEYQASWQKEFDKLGLGDWRWEVMIVPHTQTAAFWLRPVDKKTLYNFVEFFSLSITTNDAGGGHYQFRAAPGLNVQKLTSISWDMPQERWGKLGDLMHPEKILETWKKKVKWDKFLRKAKAKIM